MTNRVDCEGRDDTLTTKEVDQKHDLLGADPKGDMSKGPSILLLSITSTLQGTVVTELGSNNAAGHRDCPRHPTQLQYNGMR